jgi:hypothetical protein
MTSIVETVYFHEAKVTSLSKHLSPRTSKTKAILAVQRMLRNKVAQRRSPLL